MNTLESLVSLNLIPQIGSVRLEALLTYFNQPEAVFQASREDLSAVVGEKIAQGIRSFDRKLLKKDLALAEKANLKIITIFDESYPKLLKEIPGCPIVLYVKGELIGQDNTAFGIVGSRQATFYGLNNAQKFAGELSLQGITIVSGMARGVDTYAHRGALKAGGRTIAVMGSGFSQIYPPENEKLAEEISLSGAVISEFSMETKPLPCNFPRRNRIISGLSLGILVTEAARNSGALITADFALEQGREVFALPGRIDSNGSTGPNYLIKQGAKLVTGCQDILEELNLSPSASNPKAAGETGEIEKNSIYNLIGQEAITLDELIEKSSISSSRISGLILELQLKKLIKELPGKYFMRN